MQTARFEFPTWDKVHAFNEKTTGKQPLTKPAVELGAAVQPKP